MAVEPGFEELEVSWTAVSDADGYKVQWKSGDEEYDESRQAAVSGGEAVSYTITGLTPGTEYTVRVIVTREHADDRSAFRGSHRRTPISASCAGDRS